MGKNKQYYYRVDFEIINYESIYIKAPDKKIAIEKASKKICDEVARIDADRISKEDYDYYTE